MVLPVLGGSIGFDFSGEIPGSPNGDDAAGYHLFVHDYAVPEPGYVTGVTVRNDGPASEPEPISILILRPTLGGWTIVDRHELADAVFNHGIAGDTSYNFAVPTLVEIGDIFAHWQLQGSGPIPMNLDGIDGLSRGRFGFDSADIDVGNFIANEFFSGNRDYFINLNFVAIPEPASGTLAAVALTLVPWLARRGRRGATQKL